MYKHILIATDGSELAREAVTKGWRLPRPSAHARPPFRSAS
jgi:nucleotide-binding universal stress UspA family protein